MLYDLRKGAIIFSLLPFYPLPAHVSFITDFLKNTFPSRGRVVGEAQGPLVMALETAGLFLVHFACKVFT